MAERTCGNCSAGIVLAGTTVRACPTCKLFETDDDAMAAVAELLGVLHVCYENGNGTVGQTVADALDRVIEAGTPPDRADRLARSRDRVFGATFGAFFMGVKDSLDPISDEALAGAARLAERAARAALAAEEEGGAHA